MTEMYPITDKEMAACTDWPSVYWEDSFTVIIRNWLEENIKGYWWHNGHPGWTRCSIIFEYKEDAMAFKLRWL